jgi:phosphoribosyl 1,2-cyclic phosphodiesterase
MKIKFQVLASGSNGNCSILSNSESGYLLIDAGISRSRLFRLLRNINVQPSEIKGILISHAHSDHCNGLPVITEVLKVPVICSKDTREELSYYKHFDSRWGSIAKKAIVFEDKNPIALDFGSIYPLPTVHDSPGSLGFRINTDETSLTTITDTGQLLPIHLKAIQRSTIALIEMNHDVPALYMSNRPRWLKQRIIASHLSNEQTLEIFDNLLDYSPKILFFGHLSGECNSPNIVKNSIAKWGMDREELPWNCFICRRDKPGAVVTISENEKMSYSEKPLNLKELISSYTPPIDLMSYFE